MGSLKGRVSETRWRPRTRTDNQEVFCLGIALVLTPQVSLERVAFGEDPPKIEQTLKQSLRSARSLTELGGQLVRREVGRWFDGKRKQPIEFVWLYSPEFLAARLLNLDTVERWHQGERQKRWEQLSRHMEGRLDFYVQLAAAPKFDFTTLRASGDSDTEQIQNSRFLLLVDGTRVDPRSVELVYQEQSRGPNLFENFPWYQFVEGGDLLIREFDRKRHPQPLEGPYKLYVFRVRFDASQVAEKSTGEGVLSLRIISRTKERIATYRLKEPNL